MITRLKELLKRDNIFVNEGKFETEDGIAGLGDTPFVSIINLHILDCLNFKINDF